MSTSFQFRLRKVCRTGGFSLTEVVLAIAIVAIAVVGIMTAFPVGMTASRDARDENVVSSIAESIIAQIRAQPFSNVLLSDGSSLNLTVAQSTSSVLYFSASGAPAPKGQPTADTPYREDEAYFCVQVTSVNNPFNTVSGSGSSTLGISKLQGLAKIVVDISWPARAPTTPIDRRQHSIFVTHVANLN